MDTRTDPAPRFAVRPHYSDGLYRRVIDRRKAAAGENAFVADFDTSADAYRAADKLNASVPS